MLVMYAGEKAEMCSFPSLEFARRFWEVPENRHMILQTHYSRLLQIKYQSYFEKWSWQSSNYVGHEIQK